MFEDHKWSVIKIVQGLLSQEADKSAANIGRKVDLALSIMPPNKEEIDRQEIIDELVRRYSVWVGVDSTMINNEGHIQWLTPERKKDWRYWRRYREWQETKLPWDAVEAMDVSTDQILSMLEDPERKGHWDRRGMVVGHVQSGKTGNYTGLICKAADAGYKIIIVLAGLHNNLRSQTQMRLDEGFLGYETSPQEGIGNALIGVGTIDTSPSLRPQYVTNRSEKGDFNTKFVKNLGVSPEQKPWLFVVKKNKTVLKRLLSWIHSHVADVVDKETGRKLVTHLPLLVIDDEADHASIDTGEKVVDENGNPDMDHQPTAINSYIRQILHSFSRKAYVGYTATPFANIFIHDQGETDLEGPDLFPSAFITNLSAPSNYVGPARVFGLASENGRTGALDLARTVYDQCSEDGKSGWMPVKHKSSHVPLIDGKSELPKSLEKAILSFVLACAARELRGQGLDHSTMLVHVTRYNIVQGHVRDQVESYIRKLRQRLLRGIDCEAIYEELKALWESDFVFTSKEVSKIVSNELYANPESWCKMEKVIPDMVEQIKVRMINGTAKDALDYVDSPTGLKIIAIGGDKLARGLTLEGLCSSYFLRASKMYDTLMQMGRWFGYRPDYLDLCRLYTTPDLVEWFEHIADAAEELRSEFDYMTNSGLTPQDYGLKVRSHPVLMVTSPLKMRTAKPLYLSFSGDVVETVSFHKKPEIVEKNLSAFEDLVSQLGVAEEISSQKRSDSSEDKWNGAQWNAVTADLVIKFLEQYETHPDSRKVRSDLLADFIHQMSEAGELTSWTVAVIGGGVAERRFTVGGIEVKRAQRKNKSADSEDKYTIGRLLSPQDEGLGMGYKAWSAALEMAQKAWKSDPGRARGKELPTVPSGPYIRHVRGFGADGVVPQREQGLLLIYLLDRESSEVDELEVPVVGFAISFPSSNAGKTVRYMVNQQLWEEFGGSD